MSRGRGRLRVAAPHAEECPMCGKPLGTVALLKRPSGWVHKACWMREHE